MSIIHVLGYVLGVECMVRRENLTISVWNQMCYAVAQVTHSGCTYLLLQWANLNIA